MAEDTAVAYADEGVSRVRDDPQARLALLCRLSELLDDDLSRYVNAEHSLGHLLDVGIIVPRPQLYDWSASELRLPALNALLASPGPTPAYAWDRREADVWYPEPSRLARAAQRAITTSSPPSPRR